MNLGDLVIDYSFVPHDEDGFDVEPRPAIVIGHESSVLVKILKTNGETTVVPMALLRKLSSVKR